MMILFVFLIFGLIGGFVLFLFLIVVLLFTFFLIYLAILDSLIGLTLILATSFRFAVSSTVNLLSSCCAGVANFGYALLLASAAAASGQESVVMSRSTIGYIQIYVYIIWGVLRSVEN